VRRFWAAAALAGAFAAAGCGGGGGGSLPEGASVAPASAIAFVSVNTDFTSDQWRKVADLAAKFPGTPQLIGELKKQTKGLDFERDVKPALGPEVDLVWVDARNGGDDVVGLTKPDSKEKLQTLLEKSRSKGESKAVTAQVGDWVAIADSQKKLDSFKAAASAGDKLDGDKDFKAAFEKLDSDSSVRAWIKGGFVQTAMDSGLASNGAPQRLTHDVGDLNAISGSAKAEEDGASIELNGLISPTPDPATFSPSLPDDVPDGALLYVSTTNLAAPLKTVLDLVGKSVPNFNTQLSQVEAVLGLTLEGDIYPLLKEESALAVYRGTRQVPRILFLQKVNDEQKAESLLRRLSAIAQLGGSVRVRTVQLAGKSVQRLEIVGSGVTIYDGVAGGKLFITNASSLAEQTISGPASSLGDDPLYRSARDEANVPNKVAAFAYGDLENGLPYVLRLAVQSGNNVPPAAFANIKPLHGAVVYLVKDGDALRMSGFQTIK
jgi:Protein of unknown function (DUF3352)